MLRSQKGFGAIELVLILVILGSIGTLGWYIYHAVQTTDNTYNSAHSFTFRATNKDLATLSGTLTAGPISPVSRSGDSNSVIVTSHIVQAENSQNKVVSESKTDSQGRYVLRLLPGNYNLNIVPKIGMGILRNNLVHVVPGSNTFNIVADTGIR